MVRGKGIRAGGSGSVSPEPLFLSKEADTFSYERYWRQQGYVRVAGLDEVGRGPLAGPVVAACVVLPERCDYRPFKDSKQLTPKQRLTLYRTIVEMGALWGVALVSEQEIDRINILQASLLAMKEAIATLTQVPDFLLVDGKFPVPLPTRQQTLIKGESKSASIAAASIVAKVTRDRLMADYHQQYPAYNFLKNQGYPTAEHRRALAERGPCPIHRCTFQGVKEYFPAAP